ncbi:MAG: response regulator transcription factor [Solobacterium sp.]|nr:response regulator transcription factor [Solobacterium sp.]
MLRIAVLEDASEQVPAITREIGQFFSQNPAEYSLTVYTDPISLLSDLMVSHFSIALLDIHLQKSKLSGIDTAQRINHTSPRTQVIFITAYPGFYVNVYEARHVYVVPKIDLHTYLPAALKKAIENLRETGTHLIHINIGQQSYFIPEEKIRYVEKDLRKLIICADSTYECYGKFADLLSQAQTGCLVQCHRFYLVNINYITTVSRKGVTLLDGTWVPHSESFRNAINIKMSGDAS